MNQLKLHKKIEDYLKKGPESANIEVTRNFFINDDAKRFFFAQANESWLDGLRKNGFLDNLEKKSDDPTKYSYRMPELEYLTRMAEKEPAKVAQIINSIKIFKDNFNPEVVDTFPLDYKFASGRTDKNIDSKDP